MPYGRDAIMCQLFCASMLAVAEMLSLLTRRYPDRGNLAGWQFDCVLRLDRRGMIRNVSAEAQGATRKREPLDLRIVIDSIPALVVCALPDGSIEFVNQAWREYTGSSLEQLTGWGW